MLAEEGKLTRIMKRSGTTRIELDSVGTGDIVSIAGMAAAGIADTVATYTATKGLDPGNIEPPTMRWIITPGLRLETCIRLPCAR